MLVLSEVEGNTNRRGSRLDSTSRMRGWSIGAKLSAGFGLMFLFVVGLAVINLTGLLALQRAVDNALTEGLRIQALGTHIQNDLGIARRAEQAFLLNWQEEGYQNAVSAYLIPYGNHVSSMRQTTTELDELTAAGQAPAVTAINANAGQMASALEIYQSEFNQVTALLKNRGSGESGVVGALEAAGLKLDQEIAASLHVESIYAPFHRMRLSERSYQLRGWARYSEQVRAARQQLRAALTRADPAEARRLVLSLDQYEQAFDDLVRLDAEIGDHIDRYTAAAESIQALALDIAAEGSALADEQFIGIAEGAQAARTGMIVSAVLSVALSVLLTIVLTRQISRPLRALTDAAIQIGGGNLSVPLPTAGRDEVGILAETFRDMVGQLRDSFATLEQRVEARTAQLRASADVGRATASILDPNRLLSKVVNLISDRFGFYYAAIFTLDETGKYAVLREATGEAGGLLKERGHKLEVGGESMVGTATAMRQPRVALDVGREPVRSANPLLPDTRSEIALPLVVGDRVLGALDVQSTQEAAFDEASVAVLQSMADQVAVAIANAQSFETIQRALETTTRLYEASRALFAATTDREAYEAAGRAWTSVPGLDRLGVFMISQRDATDSPIEYWAAAEWDARSGSRLDDSLRSKAERDGGARYRPDEMPLTRLAPGDAVLVVRDADDPRLPAPMRRVTQQAGVKAALVIPLLIRGRLEGLVIGTARQPIDLREDDVRFMQAVAEQLSVVLGSLRAKEETQAALARVEHLNRHLVGEAWRSYLAMRPGGLAAESGATGVSEEASRLAIPIVVRGRTLGALALEDDDPARQWSDQEWDLLTTVAGEVAQMVENARLLEQTQLRAARESQLNEIARKIRRADDIDLILKIAAEELGQALDASHARVMLGAPTDLLGSPDGA